MLAGLAVLTGTMAGLFEGQRPLLPWLYTPAPLGIAMTMPFILAIERPEGLPAIVVRWIAARSYALYLVHFSVMNAVLIKQHQGWLSYGAGIVLDIVLSVVLAEMLHRLVEAPAMRMRPAQFGSRAVERSGSPGTEPALPSIRD